MSLASGFGVEVCINQGIMSYELLLGLTSSARNLALESWVPVVHPSLKLIEEGQNLASESHLTVSSVHCLCSRPVQRRSDRG